MKTHLVPVDGLKLYQAETGSLTSSLNRSPLIASLMPPKTSSSMKAIVQKSNLMRGGTVFDVYNSSSPVVFSSPNIDDSCLAFDWEVSSNALDIQHESRREPAASAVIPATPPYTPPVAALAPNTVDEGAAERQGAAARSLDLTDLIRLPQRTRCLATELWQSSPAFIFVVRRPGCELCQAQAILIGHLRRLLSQLGYACIAILSEDDEDIGMFQKSAWRSKIYLDHEQKFYAALGGGRPRKTSYWSLLTPKVVKLLKRSKIWQVKGTIKHTKFGNLLGGMMLIAPDDVTGRTAIQYQQLENTFGDFGDLDDIVMCAFRYSPRRHDMDIEDVEALLDENRKRRNGPLKLCEDDICSPTFRKTSLIPTDRRKSSTGSVWGRVHWGQAV